MSTDTDTASALPDDDIRELRTAADCAGLSQEFAALLEVATTSVAMADQYRAELRTLAAERDGLKAALEAERDRCALICEGIAADDKTGYGIAEDCAAAIRATTPQEPTA